MLTSPPHTLRAWATAGRTIAAWFVAVVTATLSLASVVLEIVGRVRRRRARIRSWRGRVLVTIQAVGAAAFGVLGALVVSRPRSAAARARRVLLLAAHRRQHNELYLQVVLNGGATTGINAYVLLVVNFAWLSAPVLPPTFLPLLFSDWLTTDTTMAGGRLSLCCRDHAGARRLGLEGGTTDAALAVNNPLGISTIERSRSPATSGPAPSFLSDGVDLLAHPALPTLLRELSVSRSSWVASAARYVPDRGYRTGFSEADVAAPCSSPWRSLHSPSRSRMPRYRLLRHRCGDQQGGGLRITRRSITSVYAAVGADFGVCCHSRTEAVPIGSRRPSPTTTAA